MAEKQQVKTSFLFVRLQSPTKPAGQTGPFESSCTKSNGREAGSLLTRNGLVIDTRGVAAGFHGNHKQFCGGLCNNGQHERGIGPWSTGLSHGSCLGGNVRTNDGCQVRSRGSLSPTLELSASHPGCKSINFLDLVTSNTRPQSGASSEETAKSRQQRQSPVSPSGAATNYSSTAGSWHPTPQHVSSSRKDGVRWKVEVSKPNVFEAPIFCQSPHSGNQRFTSGVVDWLPKPAGIHQENRACHSTTPAPRFSRTTSSPTSPNTLQKTETFVWVNRTSPHAQSVAKAKYQFLFGTPAEDDSLERSCFQSSGEERCMSTRSLTEQRPVEAADGVHGRIWVPSVSGLESLVWESDQIAGPQDLGSVKRTASCESRPGCSGISGSMVLMVPDSDGGHTATDVDEESLSDSVEEVKPEALAPTTGLRGFAQVLVSTTRVTTAAMFSALQNQQAELLQLGKGPTAVGENDLFKGLADERGREELAAGDKEKMQTPSLAHKDIALVVVEEGSAQALPQAEGHMGAAQMERGKDKQLAKDSEMSPVLVTERGEMMEPGPELDFASKRDVGRESHFKNEEANAAFRDSEKKTPLTAVHSEIRSDDDDEVFVSARESEQSITPETSMGNKSENLLMLAVTNKPEFECAWTSPSEVTDIFSSQFEHIMECQRLKGTSYNSLDSLDVISSTDESESGFSFEMPLTPMIQQRIKESSQLLEHGLLETASGSRVLQRRMDLTDSSDSRSEESASSSASDNMFHKSSPSAVVNGAPQLLELYQDGRKEPSTLSEGGLKEMYPDGDLELGSMEQLELHSSTDVVSNGNKSDLEAARRLAKRLYNLEGFKRSDVARHLGKNNEFSKLVAEEYLRFFDFTKLTLDQSLRFFLKAFALMGETQERERVLIHFSDRYHECNLGTIPSQDGVHCLTCALMLLNTDLHGHNIGKKMTCQDFINNLDGLNEGKDFPKDLLKIFSGLPLDSLTSKDLIIRGILSCNV
ncbi:PH and SEC7 domain-containing protein 3-like isoform X2 [Heptranchias perlo]|uniref:PH and SEC7 domain-containing protein 3-like isoform X2 n=1 Tax=Heptranchias perlo TaxID=212740 RepID=UPI0035593EE1